MSDFEQQDPLALFAQWYEQAHACGLKYPNAVNLATATAHAMPANRVVLLKDYARYGFTIFTNYESRKSAELEANQQAAMCFYWEPLDKQVRVEGTIAPASAAVSDAYFASRPRSSQIGAWASQQSRPMHSQAELAERVQQLEAQFDGQEIPRPPHWGGWSLTPSRIEFWQEKEFRLHERWEYIHAGSGWEKRWLFP